MGQIVSKLYSLAAREVKVYNIERRAEKIISKEKPTPAPMYPSTVKELNRLNEENVSMEYLQKKDNKLDEHLKKVYVTSPDPAPPMERKENPDRLLPRKEYDDFDVSYGYSEKEELTVPEGKVSLKQAIQFIADHRTNPKLHSNKAIAAQYKLNLTTTDNILEHFKMFSLHSSTKLMDKKQQSKYKILEQKVKGMNMLNISQVVKDLSESYNVRGTKVKGVKRDESNVTGGAVNEDSNKGIQGEEISNDRHVETGKNNNTSPIKKDDVEKR